MRKLIGATLMGVLVLGFGIGISGCSDETSTKSQTTTTAPGGNKTTVTDEKSVKTQGNNPPAPGKNP